MQIGMIWAQARGGVIGAGGQIPWRLPEDMAHLKATTLGCPVIMGRKTWDSLPPRFRPLPGRLNLVVSRQTDSERVLGGIFDKTQALSMISLHSSLSFCEQSGASLVWLLGGGEIYAQGMPLANRLVVTEIELDAVGDTLAPKIDAALWQETAREKHVSATGIAYSFVNYTRR